MNITYINLDDFLEVEKITGGLKDEQISGMDLEWLRNEHRRVEAEMLAMERACTEARDRHQRWSDILKRKLELG